MSDELRERVARAMTQSARWSSFWSIEDAAFLFDVALAEIQRTHAIVPHSDMIALRGIVARDELRRHGLDVPSGISGELAASPPQPPTRAGGG